MTNNAQRAVVLAEALPYIQKYAGRIVVVKYGGNAMVKPGMKESVMRDLALLAAVGVRVVLVHGGGPEITSVMDRMGMKSEFVDGLRVTGEEEAKVVTMVLSGLVNKELVSLIGQVGGRAVGLSGVDGGMLKARQLDPRLGFVGEITSVDTSVLLDALASGYIPVVSTVGFGEGGETYNINADTAAAAIASALGAESFICMTDVAGIMLDPGDPSSILASVSTDQAMELIASGTVTAGMIPKVECCVKAAQGGVPGVFIIDGRTPHSIIVELLTDEGAGTMFTAQDPLQRQREDE